MIFSIALTAGCGIMGGKQGSYPINVVQSGDGCTILRKAACIK